MAKDNGKGRTRQAKLPGFTTLEDDRIERAADDFVDARNKRMKFGEKEATKKGKLVTAILKNPKVLDVIKKNPKKKVRIGDHVLTCADVFDVRVGKAATAE